MLLSLAALLPLSFVLFPAGAPGAPVVRRCSTPVAALDYKDPLVAKEFSSIQALDTEDVEDELALSGIVPPKTMNDMDMRMMLVEMRLRKAGKLGEKKAAAPKKAPAGASEFEKALYEKPAFKELFEGWQQAQNTNAINLATEYLINPRRAKERYSGTTRYDETVEAIDAALKAKVEQVVTSGKLAWSGFPANMGEAGVKMTLEALGTIVSFEWEASDDGMSSSGTAEFEEASMAKAAIDKYDGVDMGLGTELSFEAL